jgi:DNA-binding transcriptional MerR regulator
VGALARPHYPILKSAGGKLVPENVRLSHTECNQRDYNRRKQIGTLLAKGKSLEEIAEALNRRNVPPAHSTNRWTAAMVRKAYVS